MIKLINNLKQHKKRFEKLKKNNMRYQNRSSTKKLINIYTNFIDIIDMIIRFIKKEVNQGMNISLEIVRGVLQPLRDCKIYDNMLSFYKDLETLENKVKILQVCFASFYIEVRTQKTWMTKQKLFNNLKTCFAPYSDLCDCQGARNSHTISNSNNFINKEQNYYTFENRIIEKHIKAKSTLISIGKGAASASFIFCDYHDPILFSDIENESNIDLSNENHHKLQNYRIYYKREAEDLNSLRIKKETVENIKKQPPVFNSFILKCIELQTQKMKQEIETSDKIIRDYLENNRDNDFFRNNKKENIIYFCISLSQNVEILSSSAGMAKYLNLNIDNDKETIFFHILQNKNNPCIIFSGINTPNIVKTLEEIKKLFIYDSKSFFELVVSFSCITDNTFFTQRFFNNPIKVKFENYWYEDNLSYYNSPKNSSVFANRLFFNKKIELTMEEIKFLFGENYKMVTNV